MNMKLIFATTGLLYSASTLASGPVAIIEDIQGADSKLGFMDYVAKGEVINLGASGKLVLGYMNSCRRETITGGKVTVGDKASQVDKGQVLSEDVECDGGNAKLAGQVAVTSGALAFRGAAKPNVGVRKADLTIFGTAPVVRLANADQKITIERMDEKGKTHYYNVKGKHIDLADEKLNLPLGGTYRIEDSSGNSKVFKVDKYAEMGKISVVSRLIDLK